MKGFLTLFALFSALNAHANQSAGESGSSLTPWTTSPTGAQCGQECAYSKARENLVLQAYYYSRLVDNAETAARDPARGADVIRAAGGLCHGLAAAQASECLNRLRAVAFASIQRARNAIAVNTARRDELNGEGQIRTMDPSGYNSAETGGQTQARAMMDPTLFTAEQLADLSELGAANLQNTRDGQRHVYSMSDGALNPEGIWQGAQAEYAQWIGTAARPRPEDFVAFRKNPTTGRMSEVPLNECVPPQYQSSPAGICYDTAAFRVAEAEYIGVHGDRQNGGSGLDQRLTQLASRLSSQRLDAGAVRRLRAMIRPGGPRASPTPNDIMYRSYTETLGAVGQAVDTAVQNAPPAPRPTPSARGRPGQERRLSGGPPDSRYTSTYQGGSAGVVAPTSRTPNAAADQLFQAGQQYRPRPRDPGDRRNIYVEMTDESLQNLMIRADGPTTVSPQPDGQGVVEYGPDGRPLPQARRTYHQEPSAGGSAPQSPSAPPPPSRSVGSTPQQPRQPREQQQQPRPEDSSLEDIYDGPLAPP